MSYDSQTSTSLINKLRKDVDSLTLKIATIQDQKATGVSGGASIAMTWTPRTLNTLRSDPNGLILDLSSNTFTVASGAYQVKVISPFHSTTGTRLRLWDVTNNVLIGYSVSTYVYNQTNVYLYLDARIQPHKDNVYRLDYYCDTARADGLGVATNTGDIEIYTVLEVTRLDTGMTKPQGGAGVQGPQGPAGPAGPAGPPGPAGSGTVTSVSVVTANGVSGSVADPTTTPAITLSLGAITPTSVAASGAISAGATVTGSNLSGVNTGDQVIILGGDRLLAENGDFVITESSDYILETGDVTGQGEGRITTTITPQAVTYDKMQYVSGTSRLLGRHSAAAGLIEEITLGTGISVSGGSLSLGAIQPTSVAASGNVTGANLSGNNTGDQTITLTGDVTGSGTGSFAATIGPNKVTYSKIQDASGNAKLLGSNSSGPTIQEISLGSNLSMTGNTLSSTNPGGTVTSVNVSGGETGLNTSGGPITGSGTITLAGTLEVTNGGTGATSAANALTSLGAYPASNPNGYTSNAGTVTSVGGTGTVNGISLSGTVTSSGSLTLGGTLSNVSLSSQVTDTLPIANGGTGLTSVGSQYQVLTSTGSAASWGTVDLNNGTSNTLPIAKGGTGSTTAPDALTALGAYPASNPSGYTTNVGTVTSVSASGGTTGLSFTGTPITGSGTLTLAGTLDIDNGGTGATTASAAITNLAGSATSGQFLRGNGTVVEMSSTQAADVPAIAHNTAAVSGILKPLNGGTGQSNVYTDGDLLIGKTSGSTLARAKLTAGTGITITNGSGTISIAATGTGTGDVVGPSSATSGNFVLFDGSTGKLIKGASWNQVNGDIKGPGGYSSMPDGFIYIPASTANPSSTPTNVTGSNVPLYYNTNSNTLWIHNGTSWKSVALT